MSAADFDRVGQHYTRVRQPDPRIAKIIQTALAGAESIVNIGAGTGAYEPLGKTIAAVEPSETMIAQRVAREKTTLYRAYAENLPFATNSFDAALAILTLHHWHPWQKGLQEAQRVAREKVVLFTWVGQPEDFWLADYFPEIKYVDQGLFPTLEQLSTVLGKVEVVPVPIPADCTDGFMGAYWARPGCYLDHKVRSAISTFLRVSKLEQGLKKLKDDLDNGQWHARYGDLQDLAELDLGYRLIVANP